MDRIDLPTKKRTSDDDDDDDNDVATTSGTATASAMELVLSNVLRLESLELLSECTVRVVPPCLRNVSKDERHGNGWAGVCGSGGVEAAAGAEGQVGWSRDAKRYVESVSAMIRDMDSAVLRFGSAEVSSSSSSSSSLSSVGGTRKDDDDVSDDDDCKDRHDAKRNDKSKARYLIQLHSDKFRKHLADDTLSSSSLSLAKVESEATMATEWTASFPGGSRVDVEPCGSYGAGGLGLTSARSNANVTPTLDVAVLLPTEEEDEDDDENGKECEDDDDDDDDENGKRGEERGKGGGGGGGVGVFGGKDYVNGRYFDKRNLVALHIAKYLSQKKHRDVIGTVDIVYHDGDFRRVALLLTPPPTVSTKKEALVTSSSTSSLIVAVDKQKQTDNKRRRKKKKKDADDGGNVDKKNMTKDEKKEDEAKTSDLTLDMNHGKGAGGGGDRDGEAKPSKFRVRIVFGVKSSPASSSSSSSCWMPPARLFPDRSNNKTHSSRSTHGRVSARPTPMYTNSIADDMHHLAKVALIRSAASEFNQRSSLLLRTLSFKSKSKKSISATATSAFNEALILAKIWSLQRGLLRCHDAVDVMEYALILTYLKRTGRIGSRMDALQILTALLKFVSETDWLGDGGDGVAWAKAEDAASASLALVGSSEGYRRDAFEDGLSSVPSESRWKKKAGIVMPETGMSELETVERCVQARRYEEDAGGRGRCRGVGVGDDDSASWGRRGNPFPPPPSAAATLLGSYRYCAPGPVFLDPTMTVNYLGRLSPSFVREWRYEAARAVRRLHRHADEAGGVDGSPFRELFLEDCRFFRRYDAYVRIDLGTVSFPSFGVEGVGGGKEARGTGREISARIGRNGGDADHDHGHGRDGESPGLWGDDVDDLGRYESLSRGMVRLLTAALGDRVRTVRALAAGNGETRLRAATRATTPMQQQQLGDGDGGCSIPARGHGGRRKRRGGERSEHDSIGSMAFSPLAPLSSPPAGGDVGDKDDDDDCPSAYRSRSLVLGLRIDSDASRRIVDRGPPADDVPSTESFLALWGEDKAKLRRFRDGAIVRAALWNEPAADEPPSGREGEGSDGYVAYAGDDGAMGGIVERIVRHVLRRHFCFAPRNSAASESGKGGKGRRGGRDTGMLTKHIDARFALRDVFSLIDGAAVGFAEPGREGLSDAARAHRDMMAAFDALSSFLRSNSVVPPGVSGPSRLGLPLSIDAVEPMSPCLRYSDPFPPVAHPLLGASGNVIGGGNGGAKKRKNNKVSGATMGEPILVQVRFEGSSKWPTDVGAMAAAKCAMLIQLADGIERMKRDGQGGGCGRFDGPIVVTPHYVDLGYSGYSWRILVRADQELKVLRGLRNPKPDAIELRKVLTRRHVLGAMHHSTIHAVHTRHPSAPAVVRLARRWLAAHMLSGAIPHEALELLVSSVYCHPAPLDAPATAAVGFIRFLRLLATHDWARQPLIVDPQGHLSADDASSIRSQFDSARGPEYRNGPPMYVISPNDRDVCGTIASPEGGAGQLPSPGETMPSLARESSGRGGGVVVIWSPGFTHSNPERVVLARASALAGRSEQFLTRQLAAEDDVGGGDCDGGGGSVVPRWHSVFLESAASLRSYSVLLRVDPALVVDSGCSSTAGDFVVKKVGGNFRETPFTRCMERRFLGPKPLRKNVYKNIASSEGSILHGFQPVESLVDELRRKFGRFAAFFYNGLAPDVIALLWRPEIFVPQPFSAMHSEYKRPVEDVWKEDGLIVANVDELIREIMHVARDISMDVKILDDRSIKPTTAIRGAKRKTSSDKEESDGSSSDDSDEDD